VFVVLGFAGCLPLGVFVFWARAGGGARSHWGQGDLGFIEELRNNPVQVGAETLIRMNPELDRVSTDEDAGTLTFRNNRTGEEATLNFEDVAEGRFSTTTDEGEDAVDVGEAGGRDADRRVSECRGCARLGPDLSGIDQRANTRFRRPDVMGSRERFRPRRLSVTVRGSLTSRAIRSAPGLSPGHRLGTLADHRRTCE